MAILPDFASCERVALDTAGYDARGTYHGRGAPLFRIAANDPADGGIQLDVCIRARSERAARDVLLGAIAVYGVRLAYWQSQERVYRTRLMTAIDWDNWCDRAAIRDAIVHF